MDKHVVGISVKEPEGVYEVSKMGQQKLEEWSKEKTRNETDIIRTRLTKIITQDLADDPYAQKKFSELLKEVIKEAEQLFEHPLKQYILFHDFSEQVKVRKLDDLPSELNGEPQARAYYGLLKMELSNFSEQAVNHWIDLSMQIDKEIKKAVKENSINPQYIEGTINKRLLPILFKYCEADMRKVKAIITQINKMIVIGLQED